MRSEEKISSNALASPEPPDRPGIGFVLREVVNSRRLMNNLARPATPAYIRTD